MDSSRRNLLKYMGFGGAAVVAVAASGTAGAAVAGYSVGSRKKEVEDAVREINEHGPNTLALTNTYGEIDETPTNGPLTFSNFGGKRIVPGTEKSVMVPMAPGPDGHMYLKINNEWRRIVTE
jgi:hypothetical protein